MPNSKPFQDIGLLIKEIGFDKIKNNIHSDYRDCVSKQQVKQIWNSKGNIVPLLASEIINEIVPHALLISCLF